MSLLASSAWYTFTFEPSAVTETHPARPSASEIAILFIRSSFIRFERRRAA